MQTGFPQQAPVRKLPTTGRESPRYGVPSPTGAVMPMARYGTVFFYNAFCGARQVVDPEEVGLGPLLPIVKEADIPVSSGVSMCNRSRPA
jgi:hypothetical protein